MSKFTEYLEGAKETSKTTKTTSSRAKASSASKEKASVAKRVPKRKLADSSSEFDTSDDSSSFPSPSQSPAITSNRSSRKKTNISYIELSSDSN